MPYVALSYGHGEDTYRVHHSKGVTVNGVKYAEHTHNYQVGTRVKRILTAHGVSVLEVQPPNGKDVPLATRTNQADAERVDLYYSIHANAAQPEADGWCGFYWEGSAGGLKIAKLYAKHMAALGLPLYSKDGVHPCHRGDWTNFHELRETNAVAIITENGFMTNKNDFKKIFLNEGGHWDKSAYAHAKTILEYFEITYDPYKSGEKKKVVAKPKPIAPTGAKTHKIVSGDTLWGLGEKYNIAVDQLTRWNPGINPLALQIGDVLNVAAPAKPVKKYTSIVDYCKDHGIGSDFISRRKLAEKYGIRNYTGTAAQNVALLDKLQ